MERVVTIRVLTIADPESLSTHQIDVSEVVDGMEVTTPGGVLRGQDADLAVVRAVARHMARTGPVLRAQEARGTHVTVVEK